MKMENDIQHLEGHNGNKYHRKKILRSITVNLYIYSYGIMEYGVSV